MRRGSILGMFGLLLLLCAALSAAVALRLLLPEPRYVPVGPGDAFPPAPSPYVLTVEGRLIFVVNDGREIIVLDRLYRVPGGHAVVWVESHGRFIDPGSGTHFDLYGQPVRRFRRDDQPLARYPVRLTDGMLEIAPEQFYDTPLALPLPVP